MVNVSVALGGPCVLSFNGPHLNYDSTRIEDYRSAVKLTQTGGVLPPGGIGGSGTYTAEWTTRPEQVITGSVEGLFTDESGNTYWESRKSIKFRNAYDNLPYRTTVFMVVNDSYLGTSDVRTKSVLICPSPTNCADTNRPYPGDPPPPPPMSALITGAESVPPSSTCNYFGSASNGTEPYDHEWYVNSVLQSTSSTLNVSTPSSGSVSISLKVTDANSQVAWAYKTLYIDSQATCYDQ